MTDCKLIYENTEEVDSAGPELGPDSAATGHPLPRPVQDTGLKNTFSWSSLIRGQRRRPWPPTLTHKTKLDTLQFALPVHVTKRI